MKKLILIISVMYSSAVYPIEFYQCIDSEGQSHFTNLPKSSLDKNCVQRSNQYLVMLNQDYSNLAVELKKFEVNADDEEFMGLEQENDKNSMPEMLDADTDTVLEQLLENSQEEPQNLPADLVEARTKSVQGNLKTNNFDEPVTNVKD